MPEKIKAVVVDIDGVISDNSWRLYMIAQPPKDWDTFYKNVGYDPPLPTGRDLVIGLADRYVIIYISGRHVSCTDETADWLDRHGFPIGELVLRAEGNYEAAADFKVKAIKTCEKDESLAEEAGYEIVLVIDDDPKVCDRLAREGYTVIQAGWQKNRIFPPF